MGSLFCKRIATTVFIEDIEISVLPGFNEWESDVPLAEQMAALYATILDLRSDLVFIAV
jgi:hypothetical protein